MASTTLTEREERIKEQRRSLPDSPGVYLFRDNRKRVIYVGKAKSIKKRVAGHFSKASSSRSDMVASGREHRVRRHPDRGRGAARRAELHQAVPADLQRPAARRQVVPLHRDLARREVPARLLHAREAPARRGRTSARTRTRRRCARRSTCSARCSSTAAATGAEPGRASGSPCLDYYIKRCGAPCVGYVSEEEYREGIEKVVDFLSGRYRQIERDLEGEMKAASAAQEFETAAALRNRLKAVRQPARAAADLERVGRLARRDRRGDRGDRRERAGVPGPRRRAGRPPELLPRQPGAARRGRGGRGVRAPVLRDVAGDPAAGRRPARAAGRRACSPRRSPSAAAAPVEVRHAERGDKRRILELAERNARLALDQDRLRSEHRRIQRIDALEGLQRELGMPQIPMRIECFDISNLGETHTVASMVVFEGGAPKKSDYRRFGIREAVQDDFAAMSEVLGRRMAQYVAQRERSPHEASFDASFAAVPGADRDRRRQGPAVGGPQGAPAVPRPRRDGRQPGEADRGGVRPRAGARRSCCRRTARRCSCSSASATRRTGSRSSSTAAAATRR